MSLRGNTVCFCAARSDDLDLVGSWFDSEASAAGFGPHFPRSKEWLRTQLSSDGGRALILHSEAGEPIGFVRIALGWGEHVMTIEQLVLAPSAIGLGYGSDAVWGLCRFFLEEWGRPSCRAPATRRQRARPALLPGGRLPGRGTPPAGGPIHLQVEGRRRQVVPSTWGLPADRDFLMLGLLADELVTPEAR